MYMLCYDFDVINRPKPLNLLGPSSVKLESKGDLSFFHKVEVSLFLHAVSQSGAKASSYIYLL